MKLIKLFPTIFLILTLCGCFGKEPNDISYAIAIGFDKAEDGENYNITLQFAKPTQISGGDSESGGSASPQIVEDITVEAPTLYSAVNLADSIVSKHFFLSHVNLIVFSAEVAREGVGDIMETLSRSYDIRPNVYMAVAMEGARKYLSEVKPVLEVNPAKYYQLTYEANGAGGLPKSIIEEFYFMENLPDVDSVVPLAGVMKISDEESSDEEGSSGSKGGSSEEGSSDSEGGSSGGGSSGSEGGSSESGSEENEQSSGQNQLQPQAPVNNSGFEFKVKDYKAGEVAIDETNKSEAIGMAVFKKDKMVGTFGGIECELYNIMSGEHRDLFISLEGMTGKPVTVLLRDEKKPKINVDIENRRVDINLYLESDLYSLPVDEKVEDYIEDFEKKSGANIEAACENLINTAFSEYDADILGLTRKAKRKFLTYGDFINSGISDDIKDFDINVNVDFSVRRTGLIISGEGNM